MRTVLTGLYRPDSKESLEALSVLCVTQGVYVQGVYVQGVYVQGVCVALLGTAFYKRWVPFYKGGSQLPGLPEIL